MGETAAPVPTDSACCDRAPLHDGLGDEAGERDFAASLQVFLDTVLAEAHLERRSDEHCGTGLFATRDLPHGVLIKVPRRFVLDATSAAKTLVGCQLVSGFTSEEVLLAVLAEARKPESLSAFRPYVAILPDAAPDPGSWPEAAKALLVGTDLGTALQDAELELVALHARLAFAAPSAALELSHLRWARGMLLSRRFPELKLVEAVEAVSEADEAEVGVWGELGALVPVIDFMNHHRAAVTSLKVSEASSEDVSESAVAQPPTTTTTTATATTTTASTTTTITTTARTTTTTTATAGQHIVVCNSSPRLAGEEVFNNYGTGKSNEELLAMYGFAEAENPADAVSLLLCGEG
ncbi:unnamed protein product, partial [Polarella glacialis]